MLQAGTIKVIPARREVILAASSINSPKLLMLSGIGPAAHLARAWHRRGGRPSRRGGEPAGPHGALLQYASRQPITLYKHWNLWGKATIGAQWLFTGTRPWRIEPVRGLRLHPLEAPGSTIPTSSITSCPMAVRYDGKAAAEGHGFQAHVGPMRSKSRGSVTLRSPDPQSAPVIRFNYMSHPDDWEDFRACIRLTREIFGQEAIETLRQARDTAGRAGADRRRA